MEQPIEPNQREQPANIQPAEQPPQVPAPLPAKHRQAAWVFIILAILLVAAAAFGYWEYRQSQTLKGNYAAVNNQNNQTAVILNPNANQLQPGDSNSPTTTPSGNTATSTQCKNNGPILASKSGMVQWVNPQNMDNLTLFASSSPDSDYGSDSSTLVGHFVSGKYQGGDLLVTRLYLEEMDGTSWYYIVRLGNASYSYMVLDKYSDQLPDPLSYVKPLVILAEDKDFDLPDIDFPKILHSTNPTADFTLATNLGFYRNGTESFCQDNLVKVFTDPNLGDVYTDAPDTQASYYMQGFYVKSPDGSKIIYQLTIPFVGNDNLPLVTWNGQKNTEQYSYQAVGGCGASQFLDVQDVKQSDLTQIGTTLDGQAIYGYKDSNSDELKTMYDEIYVPDGQTKPTYQQFLADNPIFFWQDPFGQFVRFKITKYQPMAECAKPVIYLYPQETEKISVQVDPAGGMLKSDPAYNYGWNVISDPQSNITNPADGQSYPYLFWEGRGGMYKIPDKGFVVAQADVHEFLTDKLRQLGLNDKESADFILFWEPKMQGSSYYFVTFMGNPVMDQLAPLSVVPKPDTIIRILMDFTPLDHPAKVQGYNIRTPVRKGFTVVEWGGVLRNEHN